MTKSVWTFEISEYTKFLHCIVISLDDYDLWNTYVCSSSVVQISPPLYICQKIIMHRVIIIALYIVYCKWYSTWYAFYKQFFVDRERVQLCWIYWWIFIAIFQLHRYRHKALLYSAFMLFPSGACSDLRFSYLGKNLKYPVFILIKSILSYYDIGLPSCMRSSNYLIIDTLTHQNTSTQFIN